MKMEWCVTHLLSCCEKKKTHENPQNGHNDLSVMTKWLNTKEVLEFFDDSTAPPSAAQVRTKYGPQIEGTLAVEPYIVETDGPAICL